MAKLRAFVKIHWSLFLEFSLLAISTCLIACLGLAIARRKFDTSLLFDQFCFLTILVFLISFFLSHNPGRFFSKSVGLLSSEAKFFASLSVALLFFSSVQYSVLAVDRSRSLYIFSWVDQGLIKSIDDQIVIGSTSVDPVGLADLTAINQRVQEQSARGLMITQGSAIKLTFSGKAVLSISKFFAYVFNLRGWYSHT